MGLVSPRVRTAALALHAVGGSGVGGSGVVQGIGSTSPEEIGGGSGGGSQARENSDLENRQIVFLGKSAITQL